MVPAAPTKSKRSAPPTRMSAWRILHWKSRGANHWPIRSGSVHARNTRSRGASSTRVITISRSRDQIVSPVVIVVLLLQVVVQAVEPLVPRPSRVLGPPGHVVERRGAQAARPLLRVAAARDEARAL